MKLLEEIRPAKESVEMELLQRPGITGVDIGPKIVDGKKTDELAIRVYVAEKKKEKDIPKGEIIPKHIDNIKTDVIQRKFVLQKRMARLEDIQIMSDTGRYDPLEGGISLGPCRAIGGYVYTGTLGAIVKCNNTNKLMLLSNFHVMCVDNKWKQGDTMAQPSRVDGGKCPSDVVGELQRSSLGGQVDCAICNITAQRKTAAKIAEIGDIAGTGTAQVGMKVRKRGRTTGLTYGKVVSLDLSVKIDYGDGLGEVTLTKQIDIEPDKTMNAKFGDHGDSGSVVVDDNNNVVGLHFAGDDGAPYHGIANPIKSVLNALNISIYVPMVVKKQESSEVFKKQEAGEKFFFKEYIDGKAISKEYIEKRLEKYPEIPKYAEIPGQPTTPSTPVEVPGYRSFEERLAKLESLIGAQEPLGAKSQKSEGIDKAPEYKYFKEKSEAYEKQTWQEINKVLQEKNPYHEIYQKYPELIQKYNEIPIKPGMPFNPVETPAYRSFEERISSLEAAASASAKMIETKASYKEFKPEKREKYEAKEFKAEMKEFKEKDLKDKMEKMRFEGDPKLIFENNPVVQPEFPAFAGPLEERLSRLEAAISQMAHFITPEMRPDLGMGALTREPDQASMDPSTLSRYLQKQASDAKQAKDNKDIEKMAER